MYGIGVNSSSMETGKTIARLLIPAASGLLGSVKSKVCALRPASFPAISRMPGQVTPEGANKNAGKEGSTMAMGPWPERRSQRKMSLREKKWPMQVMS